MFMTQIIVTLENGADSNMLRRMIENMKGVLRTSMQSRESRKESEKTEKWIEEMRNLSNNVDSSVVDMNDDRTRYLMSK